MDVDSFYRHPDPQLCQGDIFECVPHLFLKDQPRSPPQLTFAGKKAGSYLDELSQGALPKAGTEVILPASCLVARAMLLSHGCEIDKDKKHRLIALIRPLDPKMPPGDSEPIKNNRNYSFFHLPPYGDQLPESYVDFRRICPISTDWIDKKTRVASLTETAAKALLLQFVLFFTRIRLDPSLLDVNQGAEGPPG